MIRTVEKDKQKVDFLVKDLLYQQSSIERSLENNLEVIKEKDPSSAENISEGDSKSKTIEKLLAKWVEIVDLLEVKQPMLEKALEARSSVWKNYALKINEINSGISYLSKNQNAIDEYEIAHIVSKMKIEDCFFSACEGLGYEKDCTEFSDGLKALSNYFCQKKESLLRETHEECGILCSLRGHL